MNALNGIIDDVDLKMTQDRHSHSTEIPKLTQVETQALEQALSASNGNASKAARLLGISYKQHISLDPLRYRMQKLGLSKR